MGQSNTLAVAKQEESFMCSHDEETDVPCSNVDTASPGPPKHL